MSKVNYTDDQINEFIEVANELGIGPTMKELGYPGSWATAQRWFKARGIDTPDIDSLKSQASKINQFYDTKEALLVIQEGMQIIHATYLNKWDTLDADEQKKLAEAMQKLTNSMRVLQDKASTITESRYSDATQTEIDNLMKQFDNSVSLNKDSVRE